MGENVTQGMLNKLSYCTIPSALQTFAVPRSPMSTQTESRNSAGRSVYDLPKSYRMLRGKETQGLSEEMSCLG